MRKMSSKSTDRCSEIGAARQRLAAASRALAASQEVSADAMKVLDSAIKMTNRARKNVDIAKEEVESAKKFLQEAEATCDVIDVCSGDEEGRDDDRKKRRKVSTPGDDEDHTGDIVNGRRDILFLDAIAAGKRVQIIVKHFFADAPTTITLDVKTSDTISNVKVKIEDVVGFPALSQLLILNGRGNLYDCFTVGDYKIKNGTQILCGKRHGANRMWQKTWSMTM
jgi:hypothetical protein